MRPDKHICDTNGARDFQVHIIPDAQVNHSRAEIPPIIHAGLERTHTAGAPYLRLLKRGSFDHHRQEIFLTVEKLSVTSKTDRREHANMRTQAFAVQEELGLIIHALEVKPDVLAL